MDDEFICCDCLDTFNRDPIDGLEVKNCPRCGSHDVCTTFIYNRNQLDNEWDMFEEEKRLYR